ncbi:MAG: DNA polymerase III subunit alpha [Calditrichaeota bacterium]|nr:DNA polymerase III subunit alpha [Calditrichota bacterium]
MYAALNIHSYYSIGWGTTSPEIICQRARDYGCSALAITDTDSIYGLIFGLDYAKTFGVRAIVGAELSSQGRRVTLLVRNRAGYSNLCHLITKRKQDCNFMLEKALLEHSDGLVIMTDNVILLKNLFGKVQHLYAELIRAAPVVELLRTARTLGVKPVATCRAFWVDPKDYQLHRLNRAISLNTTFHDLPASECVSPRSRFLSEPEMRGAFDFCPEAVDNTLEVAGLCNWEPDFGIVYPEVNPNVNGQAIGQLRKMAYTGARNRYGQISDEVTNRLEHELKLIEEKGFAPVFLVVEDIVNKSPRTCGRGSAAASIVSYCLGITHVEPLTNKLFFERFINSARVDPPDIDIDFAWDERDDVLDYVFNKYGVDNAAMVSNHVTFQKRSAIRETAKVYGLPDAEIGAVTKKISYSFRFNEMELQEQPALREQSFAPPWDEILVLAERLDGIPRHLSVHCGGVVVTPGPTANWVPTEVAPKGVRIIQWEKDQTEDSGLVKIDLLGNRSLAVIRDALIAVKENHNVEIDYSSWTPQTDPATQDLIARGDTMGVFYVESPATRLLQKKAGVGDYDHLVLHSSMIRPAANKFINEYLRRLKGEPYEPLHPLIGDLLDDNYGVMVYQEDVTRVAMKLANFPLPEAEELRKILSKKHKHRRLLDLRQKFYDGARQNGAELETIDKIWEMIMSFAGYSFCKPHSASYALVSFKSAYLRAHFPAEFMAAVISNMGGFYATFAYVSEAKRMEIIALPPDINKSRIKYFGMTNCEPIARHSRAGWNPENTVSNATPPSSQVETPNGTHPTPRGWLRVGLMQIKGLSEDTLEHIIEAREESLFVNFEDCIKRAKLTPSEARLLVLAGCFDRLEKDKSRPELLWTLALSDDKKHKETQGSLFATPKRKAPKPPQYSPDTFLKQEVETLGFLISQHPLELYKKALEYRPVVQGKHLHRYIGQKVEFAGWLVTGKIVPTKDREQMEFVTFEDTTALIETVLFPDAFKRFSHIINYTRPYRLFGKVEEDFGAVTVSVERVGYL